MVYQCGKRYFEKTGRVSLSLKIGGTGGGSTRGVKGGPKEAVDGCEDIILEGSIRVPYD